MFAQHAVWPFPAEISCDDMCKSTDPRIPRFLPVLGSNFTTQLPGGAVIQPVNLAGWPG
jgi:hypothetical protein